MAARQWLRLRPTNSASVPWASRVFVASTIALLVWTRLEAVWQGPFSTWPERFLMGVSVVTLPDGLRRAQAVPSYNEGGLASPSPARYHNLRVVGSSPTAATGIRTT